MERSNQLGTTDDALARRVMKLMGKSLYRLETMGVESKKVDAVGEKMREGVG